MPYYKNAQKLKNAIDQLDQLLSSIFADRKINKVFEQQLNQVKKFYRRAFNKTANESTGCNIIKEYEDLIEKIKKVKHGELTVNQTIEEINNSTEGKRIDIIIHNILNACELLFWATASAFFYVGCVTAGIPLMLCEPIIGSVITLGSAAFLFNSLVSAIQCFEQFKSLDRINDEEVREQNLISFFSTTTHTNRLNAENYCKNETRNYNLTPTYQ
jgi:hypothetical protein